jgi:hypothetical protein
MIQDFLKLSCCLAMTPHPGISETTHVNRIESSEEGSACKVCSARNGEVVRCGGLRHFECFCWITPVKRLKPPQRGQVTELDRRILRIKLFELRREVRGLRRSAEERKRKSWSIIGIPASEKGQRRRRASLCFHAVPEQRIPRRRSALKHGSPPGQSSVASQGYRAFR